MKAFGAENAQLSKKKTHNFCQVQITHFYENIYLNKLSVYTIDLILLHGNLTMLQ